MTRYKINWGGITRDQRRQRDLTDLGLLALRLAVAALMLFGHGFDKLVNFSAKAAHFPDPLGLGGATSLALAVAAEFACSLAIAFGILTRFATIPLIVTMLTAAFIVHGGDPWGKKELALVYLVPYLTLLFTGAGRYSLDSQLFEKKDAG